MTKLMTTLTFSVIATVLITGGFVFAPDAYSDKKHDDAPDECGCEKPDTLKVHFTAPEEGDYRVEIFKKLDDRNDPDKLLLPSIPNVTQEYDLTISAISFAKDKLESNTAFVIYEVDGAPDSANAGEFVDKEVALMEIHTSCSKPLFIGMKVFDVNDSSNGYSLEVIDGLKNTMTSIPLSEPLTCEDKKSKHIGSIVIRKAITNDNGGNANATDFTIKLTNMEDGKETILVHDLDDSTNPNVNLNEVPVGTYKITESYPNTVTGTYTTVLITGDDKCPAMVDEAFTIKKGKTLSCTIYNDDNGDGLGGTGGPGGIVFQNNSMEIEMNAMGEILPELDSCDHYDDDIKRNPCIQMLGQEGIGIVDEALESTTTIVLFSVLEKILDLEDGAEDAECSQERIISHNSTSAILMDSGNNDIPFVVDPTENLMVMLGCAGLDPPEEGESNIIYKVNYIMIDPNFGS